MTENIHKKFTSSKSRIERSQLKWFWRLVRTPPWGGVLGLSSWEGSPGKISDTLGRLHLSVGLGTSSDSSGGAVEDRSVWASLLRLLPSRPRPG